MSYTLFWPKRGDVAGESNAPTGRPLGHFTPLARREQIAPPCPFCDSADTVVIGHNGAHGTITLCRCNACRNEWPETISDDPDQLESAQHGAELIRLGK